MTATQTVNETGCCPRFDPEPWDDKLFTWEHKKFIRDRVFTLFYMPLNFGAVMKRLGKKIDQAGALMPDGLCLADHTSKWNMDIYLAVDKDVPGTECTDLSGTYFGKVYEGPFKDTAKWCKEYESVVGAKGMKIKKWLMWYTTCPKCAKVYGKNYVTILSEVGTQ